jgi:molecular chaperone DnaK
VTITASTNLNKSDIDRMMQEAREHETDDHKRRELIEARNTADSLAYQTGKTLKDLGEKIPESERQNIERKIKELREAIQGEDVSRIKSMADDLQNAFHAISQQLYAQQAQTGPAAPGGNGNGHGPGPEDEGEVVEGEFREA